MRRFYENSRLTYNIVDTHERSKQLKPQIYSGEKSKGIRLAWHVACHRSQPAEVGKAWNAVSQRGWRAASTQPSHGCHEPDRLGRLHVHRVLEVPGEADLLKVRWGWIRRRPIWASTTPASAQIRNARVSSYVESVAQPMLALMRNPQSSPWQLSAKCVGG
jgi:hypothetical protein